MVTAVETLNPYTVTYYSQEILRHNPKFIELLHTQVLVSPANQNIQTFGNAREFTNSIMTVTDLYYISDEFVCFLDFTTRLNSAIACNHSVRNPLFSRPLWKKLNVTVTSYEVQGASKKNFTTLKTSIKLFRGHVKCLELSQCSKSHRVLPGIITVECDFQWISSHTYR
jgi:hypothetical protein